MYKVKGFDVARQIAEREKCAYGISVVSADYYVGTKAELDKLPVVIQFDYSMKTESEG